MGVITLTTDFGSGDYEIGMLSGVIWNIAPDARVIDLSHHIERHNVRQGALLLERCTPYFPPGTIHIGVVDPGVGTGRRPLAARLGEQWFVGPDNGLLTLMLRQAQRAGGPVEIVHATDSRYWLPEISTIFHGRDIFSALAAHLAAGVPLSALGPAVTDPVRLDFPEPQPLETGWLGQIIDIDHFGNIQVNISQEQLAALGKVSIRSGKFQIDRLVRTFGDGLPGDLIALIDSSNYLSICVVNGSAAEHMNARIGDAVQVRPE